ncbi:MAG: HAMP domain-containing sensor histidine kinase [Fuerstiella sp.]
MDVTRKTSTPAPSTESDQQDWGLEILQALVSPSTAEDAALACAAAWMNFVHAERVAVAVFESSTSCIVAHGQRDNDTHVTIYVGRETTSVAQLLRPASLCSVGGPCIIDEPTEVLCWPEHLAAVLIRRDETLVDEERSDLIQDLSRKLLARWTTPLTSFANAGHMEAMAEFAAGAGHEINNPLGSIIGQAQLLLKRTDKVDHQQALETIGAQAWRIRDMIGDTMLFARPPQPEFTNCDFGRIVEAVVGQLQKTFTDVDVALNLPTSTVTSFADESQLSTLVSHLLRNAFQAVQSNEGGDGAITVHLDCDAGFAASLSVTDNGPEIPEEIRKHLFDPFFSGRQAGRGLGFGLCHCWQIVRMHNGILMQESLEQGNRFLVVLPTESASGPT